MVTDISMDDSRAIDDTDIVATRGVKAVRLKALCDLIARQLEARRTLLRFTMVGALGYVIYTGLLLLLYDLSILRFMLAKDTSVHLLLFIHDDSLLLITTLIGTQATIIGVFIGHSLGTFANREVARKPLWIRFPQFEARALASTLGILTVAGQWHSSGPRRTPHRSAPCGPSGRVHLELVLGQQVNLATGPRLAVRSAC
jgi:putative flippase GtrA